MRCTVAASLAGFLVMLIIAPKVFAVGDCPGTKVKYQGKCVYPDSVPVKTPPKKKAAPARPVDPSNPAGIDWVRVEGGTFLMGSDRGHSDERPRHRVTVRTFEMARTEVTVEQYRRCVEAGACTKPDTGDACNWGKAGRDRHPVNCVDWNQAQAFARWAGGRLPSEAEWEYAARSGGQEREYPWGNETPTCERAVFGHPRACTASDPCGCGRNMTWPVCSRPGGNTEQGLCDMAGNVWEWVQDWYHDTYDGAPGDGRAWEEPSGTSRVGRGGSWSNDSLWLRASNRNRGGPGVRIAAWAFVFRGRFPDPLPFDRLTLWGWLPREEGMKVRMFTMRLDPSRGVFDDRDLVEFQEGREVIEVSDHFFVHEHVPTVAVLLRYRDADAPRGRSGDDAGRKDWRAELDEPGRRRYDELRLWRGRTAKRDGLPPYLVLTNREMAELAERRPRTITAIREIEGIGESKATRWGDEILAVLGACDAAEANGAPRPDPEEGLT